MTDTTTSQPGQIQKPTSLALSICVGWGLGSVGVAMMYGVTNLLILRFMTDYLGIAAVAGGLVIGVSKLYDAITDPIMGVVSDRTKSRWGRRRPYMFFGGFLLAASMILLFNVPAFESTTNTLLYMLILMLFYATAYTIFNVPYLAMPAEMTEGYHERSFLISFRVYGVAAAGIFGLFGGPMLIELYGGGQAGHAAMAWVLGAIILVSALASFWMTRDAPFTEESASTKYTFREQFSTAIENKPYLLLLGSKLAGLFGFALSQPAIAFFYTNVLEVTDDFLGYYFLVFYISMIGSQSFWIRVSKVRGKKLIFMLCIALNMLGNLSWLLAGPEEPFSVMLLRALLLGFIGGGSLLMGQSMLPDTIEYDYRRTGLRREGIFAAFFTTIEKLAYTIGPAVTGIFLGAMGYISSKGAQDIVQPDSAITAIYICVGVIPATMGIFGLLFLSAYDLTEEKLKSTVRVSMKRS